MKDLIIFLNYLINVSIIAELSEIIKTLNIVRNVKKSLFKNSKCKKDLI